MIDPVVVAAVALSGYRLVTSAERGTSRLAAEQEEYRLVKYVKRLPAGTEIGEVRADGSSWWIRVPATSSS